MSKPEASATLEVKTALEMMDPKGEVNTLEEWVRVRARMLLCGLAMVGYGRCRVLEGYRSLQRAGVLYGKGRSATEVGLVGLPREVAQPAAKQVTWIQPKYNGHVRRRAVDIDLTMYTELNDEAVGGLARAVGMTWGGVWSVRDTYHFEI